MKAIQEISLSKKTINQSFIMAFLFFAGGIILFVITGFMMLIGFGILYLIIAILNNNLKIVKVRKEYLEVKLGAIAPKKFIKFDEVKKFNTINNFLEIHYQDEENKSKRVKIATKVLEKEDIQALHTILSENTNLDTSNQFISV